MPIPSSLAISESMDPAEVHISATAQDVQAQLSQSPALRSQLKRMLDGSE